MEASPDTLRSGYSSRPVDLAPYDDDGNLLGISETPNRKARAEFEARDIDYAINNVRNLLVAAFEHAPVPWVPFTRIWSGVLHREETAREALDLLVKQGLVNHNRRLDHYRISGVRYGSKN